MTSKNKEKYNNRVLIRIGGFVQNTQSRSRRYKQGVCGCAPASKILKNSGTGFFNMVQMASHLRCLLLHGNGDFRGRVLVRIGGLYKTHNAVTGILRYVEGNDNLSSWKIKKHCHA